MNEKKNFAPYFKKGKSGNPMGRPPKVTTQARRAGYTLDDVRARIKVLIQMNIKQMDEIILSETSIMLDKIIANALVTDFKKGYIHTLDSLLTRVWGAPKQTIENTGRDGGPMELAIVDDETLRKVAAAAAKGKTLKKENE